MLWPIHHLTSGQETNTCFAPDRPSAASRTSTEPTLSLHASSGGELLLFCDADDIVGEAWIERMVDGLRRYPAAGGRIERWRRNDQTAVAVRPPKGDQLLDGTFGFLLYPMGANCGMRRDAWSQLGGFVDLTSPIPSHRSRQGAN
ncbi:MAG: hypothetical protein QOF69_1493 [Solirubrobacteraceae bacterium]|nr:hypothetical protein [Solirubrobacteraceae bacterium]